MLWYWFVSEFGSLTHLFEGKVYFLSQTLVGCWNLNCQQVTRNNERKFYSLSATSSESLVSSSRTFLWRRLPKGGAYSAIFNLTEASWDLSMSLGHASSSSGQVLNRSPHVRHEMCSVYSFQKLEAFGIYLRVAFIWRIRYTIWAWPGLRG